jgi:hypothetical protein
MQDKLKYNPFLLKNSRKNYAKPFKLYITTNIFIGCYISLKWPVNILQYPN